jgi:hypothetical protein
MKNLLIGFVLGYLVCSYMFGGNEAIANVIGQAFNQIGTWISQIKESIG